MLVCCAWQSLHIERRIHSTTVGLALETQSQHENLESLRCQPVNFLFSNAHAQSKSYTYAHPAFDLTNSRLVVQVSGWQFSSGLVPLERIAVSQRIILAAWTQVTIAVLLLL